MKIYHYILIVAVSLIVITGCSCSRDDESLAKKIGSSVGEAVTDFSKGVGKGVDDKLNVTVELSETLKNMGISYTVAKIDFLGSKDKSTNLTVYLTSVNKYQGTLIAKAINKSGQEIGRASSQVKLGANDAAYLSFPFQAEVDTQMVVKYIIEVTI